MAASVAVQPSIAIPLPTPAHVTGTRSGVWHGLRVGLERGTLLTVALVGGLSVLEFGSGLGWFADFLIGVALMAALYSGLSALVHLIWKLLTLSVQGLGKLLSRQIGDKALAPSRFMRQVRAQLLGALLAPIAIIFMDKIKIGDMSMISQPAVTESLIPFGLIASALVGVALAGGVRRRARAVLLVMAVAILALPVAWYLWPGTTEYLAKPDAVASSALPTFAFDNPAQAGPFPVQTLSYGSGQGRRSEYGKGAALLTQTVNAKPAYEGWNGIAGAFYSWLFGGDFERLSLNGLVWYPQGQGPFPIVLIVHGNHKASEYSDPGYAYLGEHFASRGFITVSVDENFLNGHAMWDGEGNEMPVRAWLLLEHLQVWRQWNATPGNPFYGKVDLDQVVLMGHSRGGEAVAHAAMLNNKLDKPLTSLAKDGDYGFGIRGVVAIAPADGQYKPHGLTRVIKDMSYLLIQGGHDQDLSSLAGIRQYNRVKFEANPDAFKAVAYVYRANHGNFSSVWAANDHGPSASMLLNRAGLLTGEEQQMAARVFMTAFLETTLHGKNEYRQVFVTPTRARDWLPEDVYITQYDDASYQAVNTHERAGKLERIDMAEGKATTLGMTPPFKQALILRDGISQNNTALRAAWDAGANPSYTLSLPQGSNSDIMLTGEERLAFDLANLMEDQTPFFVTVELLDAKGKVSVLPVSRFGVLPPPVPAKLQKSKAISNLLGSDFFPKVNSPYERVLQSYEIPLSAFVAVNMDFDPQHIKMIRFRFNDEMSGKVYVDQVGFRG